jgi:arsenite methyltransferase
MVEKANRNASLAGQTNVDIRLSDVSNLPLANGSVDVVVSNGVFNLCPDKPKVLAALYRVLRPGGRVQMADVLLHDDVTPDEVAKKGEWPDCIAGAIWRKSLLEMLTDAGFVDARFHGWTGYHTSGSTEGALVTARKPEEN